MRDTSRPATFPGLGWLLCVIAGGYVVQNIFLIWFGGAIKDGFFNAFTLSADGMSRGFVWSLLTHGLIHDPHNLLHVCVVLFMVFMIGRVVVASIGPKHLLAVFAAAVATGGAAWLVVNWSREGVFYGASAGVSALIVLFACLSPRQPITVFFFDFGLKAKHLAIGWAIFHAAGLLLQEIPGRASWLTMAHSAQLGGMLVGWGYHRWIHQRAGSRDFFDTKPDIEPPKWARKSIKGDMPAPAFKVDITPAPSVEDMRAEVDRILDKINSEGFHSLTAEEKRRLDNARDHLSRR